jgi:type IV fimbrial biogenesis protein FimT
LHFISFTSKILRHWKLIYQGMMNMAKKYRHLKNDRKTPQSGFSLIEALLCLALISTLSLLVGPSFTHLYQHKQADNEINRLAQLLRFARAQALNYTRPISVCPSTYGRACGDRWEMGAMVFVDHDKNNQREEHEALLKLKTPLSDEGSITFSGSRNKLSFSAHAIAEGNAGSFIYCPPDHDARRARSLVINFQGRTRAGADRNNDQIEEATNGKNIACAQH